MVSDCSLNRLMLLPLLLLLLLLTGIMLRRILLMFPNVSLSHSWLVDGATVLIAGGVPEPTAC